MKSIACSIIGIMIFVAPLSAQEVRQHEECRPVPIGGGVSFQPDCPYRREDEVRRQRNEGKSTAPYIRVPSNCRLVEIKVPDRKNPRDKEATITLKCVRPILLRDDYGRSRN